ncbi:MAG: flagellar biosynthesis protein FlgA [Dactylosporangium sp.]|nr:flagellar biosynthesis protein FlgA [Dactylosporangium sp.]NNJ63505.1 flagellar biosynthesis protein FlgA [Dactylosporangium sp.]
MTQLPSRAPGPVMAGPIAAPRIVRQRRIRGGHLALAVLLVALGGLLAGVAFLASIRVQTCLAVTRAVPAGTQLTNADITTVQINAPPGLKPIPASDVGEVLGKRAAVSLVPGTLLTAAQLTDQPLAGPDQRQIGISLKPERMPAPALHPGDEVQLVVTASPSSLTATQQTASVTVPPEIFSAVVIDTGQPGTDGSTVVYVAVGESDAPRVVSLAAEGRITMILTAVR